jgi:hypothetical protein
MSCAARSLKGRLQSGYYQKGQGDSPINGKGITHQLKAFLFRKKFGDVAP